METRLRKVHEALQTKPHHSKNLLQQVLFISQLPICLSYLYI